MFEDTVVEITAVTPKIPAPVNLAGGLEPIKKEPFVFSDPFSLKWQRNKRQVIERPIWELEISSTEKMLRQHLSIG